MKFKFTKVYLTIMLMLSIIPLHQIYSAEETIEEIVQTDESHQTETVTPDSYGTFEGSTDTNDFNPILGAVIIQVKNEDEFLNAIQNTAAHIHIQLLNTIVVTKPSTITNRQSDITIDGGSQKNKLIYEHNTTAMFTFSASSQIRSFLIQNTTMGLNSIGGFIDIKDSSSSKTGLSLKDVDFFGTGFIKHPNGEVLIYDSDITLLTTSQLKLKFLELQNTSLYFSVQNLGEYKKLNLSGNNNLDSTGIASSLYTLKASEISVEGSSKSTFYNIRPLAVNQIKGADSSSILDIAVYDDALYGGVFGITPGSTLSISDLTFNLNSSNSEKNLIPLVVSNANINFKNVNYTVEGFKDFFGHSIWSGSIESEKNVHVIVENSNIDIHLNHIENSIFKERKLHFILSTIQINVDSFENNLIIATEVAVEQSELDININNNTTDGNNLIKFNHTKITQIRSFGTFAVNNANFSLNDGGAEIPDTDRSDIYNIGKSYLSVSSNKELNLVDLNYELPNINGALFILQISNQQIYSNSSLSSTNLLLSKPNSNLEFNYLERVDTLYNFYNILNLSFNNTKTVGLITGLLVNLLDFLLCGVLSILDFLFNCGNKPENIPITFDLYGLTKFTELQIGGIFTKIMNVQNDKLYVEGSEDLELSISKLYNNNNPDLDWKPLYLNITSNQLAYDLSNYDYGAYILRIMKGDLVRYHEFVYEEPERIAFTNIPTDIDFGSLLASPYNEVVVNDTDHLVIRDTLKESKDWTLEVWLVSPLTNEKNQTLDADLKISDYTVSSNVISINKNSEMFINDGNNFTLKHPL